jgi:hypothetical protein
MREEGEAGTKKRKRGRKGLGGRTVGLMKGQPLDEVPMALNKDFNAEAGASMACNIEAGASMACNIEACNIDEGRQHGRD